MISSCSPKKLRRDRERDEKRIKDFGRTDSSGRDSKNKNSSLDVERARDIKNTEANRSSYSLKDSSETKNNGGSNANRLHPDPKEFARSKIYLQVFILLLYAIFLIIKKDIVISFHSCGIKLCVDNLTFFNCVVTQYVCTCNLRWPIWQTRTNKPVVFTCCWPYERVNGSPFSVPSFTYRYDPLSEVSNFCDVTVKC